jgi:hypothetical protein
MKPIEKSLFAPNRTLAEQRKKALDEAAARRNPERFRRDNKNRKIR